MSEQKAKAGVRQRIAADVAEHYDAIQANLIAAASGATKEAWTTCTHCSRRSPVKVPDYGQSVKAAQLLLDQGFGRPTADQVASDKGRQVDHLMGKPLEELTLEELTLLLDFHDSQKTPDQREAEQAKEREEFERFKKKYPASLSEDLREAYVKHQLAWSELCEAKRKAEYAGVAVNG